MKLVNAIIATDYELPPVQGMYEYVVCANGLFVRAEDSRMSAFVNVGRVSHPLPGLIDGIPQFQLKLPKVPRSILSHILETSRDYDRLEVMFQLQYFQGAWSIVVPEQQQSYAAVSYVDNPNTVIDVHSHHHIDAFFSRQDDRDEQGFRLYVVLGRIFDERPHIICRVGVYGTHATVAATEIFADVGGFHDAAYTFQYPTREEN